MICTIVVSSYVAFGSNVTTLLSAVGTTVVREM